MNASIDVEFERAVRALAERMPVSEEGSRKPILFHDIRVGVFLYGKGYSRNIVLAGLLHDALEWSDMSEEALRDGFGEDVLRIVQANSKDRTIEDSRERIDDMVRRCAEVGEDALIVKTADTIDSFEHYTKTGNTGEIERHCMPIAEAILRLKPHNYQDAIYEDLHPWSVGERTKSKQA
ncbi:MAG: HD domain-containing protein [Candidatus Moranbacteria bacterium]|nr:HD domain-containing protein [Candidatus Moranbacteria bacterium]